MGDTLAAIDSLQYLLLSRKDNEALQLSITNGSLSSTDKLVQDQAELHKQIGILYSEMLRISLTSTTENATSSNQETLVDSISVPSDNRKALIDHVHYHYGEAIKLGVYDVDIRQFYAEFPLSTVPPSLTAGSSSDVGRIHEIMESNSSIPSQFSKEGSTHHGNGHRWVVRHLAESKEKGILKRKYTVKSLDELPQLPELSLDNLDLARQRLESELADSGEVDGVSGNQVGSSDHGITTTETQRRKSVNNKV